MTTLPPALPHGDLREVFPDVFFVTGTSRAHFSGVDWQFSRNMVVVRSAGKLTLINTVRLDDAGLAALAALGEVASVVRLGAFHGRDDAFYLERYGAELWALAGMKHEHDRPTDHELAPGGPMPLPGASLFVFETASAPEGILVLDRDDGVLVSCDSLQNWETTDPYFSEDSKQKMAALGFIRKANIGPGWRQGTGVSASDFARLGGLSFRHVLPAHGSPLLHEARERYAETFARDFGVTS